MAELTDTVAVADTTIGLTIVFHTPFRVGAALGRHGVDLTVDDPLPTTHLKGLFRSTARDLLGVPESLVEQTFGGHRCASRWAWSAVAPSPPLSWTFPIRTRVAIDPVDFSARDRHLVTDQRSWTPEATCTLTWYGGQDDDPGQRDREALVLRAAAAGTRHLGGWRRRGLGQVTISPTPSIGERDIAVLHDLCRGGVR